MRLPPPLFKYLWLVLPLLATGWLLWAGSVRMARVRYVTGVVPGDAALSPASPTGYAGGVRDLIVPAQSVDSFHWIAQTQQMLAGGEWRVRRITYENAPFGREIYTPSPYRWWLGFVAWIDGRFSGRPTGAAVEHAALAADPALQLLLLAVTVIFASWRLGVWAAALASISVAWLFPLAAGFPPGAPADKTLSLLCAVLSILLLHAGLRSARGVPTPRQANRWFFAGGVAGGFGLWVSATEQVPVILGLALGAVLAAWALRREPASDVRPGSWLAWALGGAGSSLVFYLLEYYPNHLGSWRLQENHPLYALAWLGLGTALAPLTAVIRGRETLRSFRNGTAIVFALAGLGAVGGTMAKYHDAGFLSLDTWTFRVTRASGGPEAASLWAWLSHDGITAAACATLLPLLAVLPAGWLLWRRDVPAPARASVALGLGPVLLVAGLACWQLGRWSSADATLLILLGGIMAAIRKSSTRPATPWLWAVGLAALLLPGALLLRPPGGAPGATALNETEVSGLIARDLAHWLARRTAGDKPVVLAPPDVTMALSYYGGLPGIGTLSWGNQEGFSAAARIFAATTPQEALARIQRRGVTHIIVPSWDTYLNEYLRLSAVQPEYAFVSGLRNWAPIPWLRPIAYQLPTVPGNEGQYVAVFEVVPEQDEATILGSQAEYFADMGQMEFAAATAQALRRFPSDFGALISRGQVAMARRDAAGLQEVLDHLAPRLAAGADLNLSWSRRVGLAALLAQARRMDSARDQMRRCLADASAQRLRTISTASLYRLLVLAKLFHLDFPDPALRALARDLLPAESRAQL